MALLLGLMAALGIGSTDLFGRRLVNVSSAVTAATAIQFFAGSITIVFAVVTASAFQATPFVWGCISGLGIGVGLGLYYLGLQRSSATLVAPISASIAAFVPYWYAVAGGSGATSLAIVGVVVAVGGLVLVTGGSVARDRVVAGIQFGVTSGLAYAATTIAFIKAADSEGLWPVAGQRSTGAVLLFIVATVIGHRRWPPPGHAFNGAASGLIMAFVSIALLAALAIDAAPAAAALSAVPVFSVIVGRLAFADPLERSQVFGIALVVAGIAALSLG